MRPELCTGGAHSPDAVSLGGTSAVEVACGRYHTVVLSADGSVRAFGRGVEGQLGGADAEFWAAEPSVVSGVGEDNVGGGGRPHPHT